MDPRAIVEQGYNHVAETYRDWAGDDQGGVRTRYAQVLLDRLPAGARVLELGCGTGVPITRLLSARFAVTAVDLSARHVAIARAAVPAATFVHGDMSRLDFPAGLFAGVLAFYSIIHVPREDHAALFGSVARWLEPGGLFIATLGVTGTEAGLEDDWLGAPMYWSHFDSATNQALLRQAGFRILAANEETIDEDGRPVTFLWIVAQKPEADR